MPFNAWWREVDLNHRPLGYEPSGLPNCPTALCIPTTVSHAVYGCTRRVEDSNPTACAALPLSKRAATPVSATLHCRCAGGNPLALPSYLQALLAGNLSITPLPAVLARCSPAQRLPPYTDHPTKVRQVRVMHLGVKVQTEPRRYQVTDAGTPIYLRQRGAGGYWLESPWTLLDSGLLGKPYICSASHTLFPPQRSTD